MVSVLKVVYIRSITFSCCAPGRESCWSVDGELLANNQVRGKVYRGLVEVFARGIET